MHPLDVEKIVFITPIMNYCYKVMLFRRKNAGATHQRLMNKVFVDHSGALIEIYINDMLVKMADDGKPLSDLEVVFNCLRRYKMRLNP